MKLYYLIAAIILILIYFSIIILRKGKKGLTESWDYKSEGTNIALGITKCKALHRELVKLIHPDRIQEDKRAAADQLVQEINSAKYDYRKLLELKEQVSKFINHLP